MVWIVIFHGWDPTLILPSAWQLQEHSASQGGRKRHFPAEMSMKIPALWALNAFIHTSELMKSGGMAAETLCRRGTNPHSTPWTTRMPQTSHSGLCSWEIAPVSSKNHGVEWEFLAVETSLFTLWLTLTKLSSCHSPLLPVSINLDLFRVGTCFSPAWMRWHLGVWHLGGCEISMPLGNNRAEGRRQFVWKKRKSVWEHQWCLNMCRKCNINISN